MLGTWDVGLRHLVLVGIRMLCLKDVRIVDVLTELVPLPALLLTELGWAVAMTH